MKINMAKSEKSDMTFHYRRYIKLKQILPIIPYYIPDVIKIIRSRKIEEYRSYMKIKKEIEKKQGWRFIKD